MSSRQSDEALPGAGLTHGPAKPWGEAARCSADVVATALTSAAAAAFLFFVFFPYIQLVPLQTDTQPYALLLAGLLILGARRWALPAEFVPLLIAFLFSIGVAMLAPVRLMTFRAIANYASILLIPWATFLVLRMRNGFPPGTLRVVIAAWFVVGLVQTFVYPDFLVFLMPRGLGTAGRGGRGVVGLSPEPTHYGMICMFLLVLCFMARGRVLARRDFNLLAAALIVQIVVFAKSAMAALFLLIGIATYIAVNLLSIKRLAYAFASFAAGGGSVMALIRAGIITVEGTRMFTLLGRLIENPRLLLMVDASVNDRFFNIFFSILGFLESYFLPNGYTTWGEYLDQTIPRFAPYAWWVSPTRIMSGYGAALFEIGFVGLLIPLAVNVGLFRFFGNDVRSFVTVALVLNLMLLAAIPIATPMIGLILGFAAYYSRDGAEVHTTGADDVRARRLHFQGPGELGSGRYADA